MLAEMKEIVEYLRENYRTYVELCGRDDDINTLPAKEAYKKSMKVYSALQTEIRKER